MIPSLHTFLYFQKLVSCVCVCVFFGEGGGGEGCWNVMAYISVVVCVCVGYLSNGVNNEVLNEIVAALD